MSHRVEIIRHTSDYEEYVDVIRAIVEHWDKIAFVVSIYNRDDQYHLEGFKAFLEELEENFSFGLFDEWGFEIAFHDEQFAVWFKLRYS